MQLFLISINLPNGREVHHPFDTSPEFKTSDELHTYVELTHPDWTSLVVTVLPNRVK